MVDGRVSQLHGSIQFTTDNCGIRPCFRNFDYTDNTLHATDYNSRRVPKKFKSCIEDLFKRFDQNHMKANADKCNLSLATNDSNTIILVNLL